MDFKYLLRNNNKRFSLAMMMTLTGEFKLGLLLVRVNFTSENLLFFNITSAFVLERIFCGWKVSENIQYFQGKGGIPSSFPHIQKAIKHCSKYPALFS